MKNWLLSLSATKHSLGVILLGTCMNKPGHGNVHGPVQRSEPKMKYKDVFGGLQTLVSSAWHESNTTSDITTLFWPHQDGHQFWAQPANFKQLKSSFCLPYYTKKGWQCFQVRFKLYY